MLNRISQRLWPIEYWQNKKKQFMAGGLSGRRIWLASGLAGLAVLFSVTVAAGILTARPYEQARHIPLRPLSEDQLLPSQLLQRDPSEVATKQIAQRKAVDNNSLSTPEPVIPAHPSAWPTPGAINHEFGWQEHPVLKDWRYHIGVDLSAAAGQPVTAALSGKVTELRQDARTGLTVIISAGSWTVHHGSLATATVKPGDPVIAGQTIGSAGESFQEPYPHIHLAIEKNGQFVNPIEVLPSR
ncbi:MAG: putative peptidase [Anaerosporomusa subterranea]|jgi:murein DD-endopeptidase MepM/ murein hydrolase activator NlpD|nr:putative peptidase [Anaerosporomusa subterranea]